MFPVARDFHKMFVLYRGKHATRSSMVGIWSEVRLYRAPVHEYIVGLRSAVGQVYRQPAKRLACGSEDVTQYNTDNPCINLHVPPSTTCEYHPKALELLDLLQCIPA